MQVWIFPAVGHWKEWRSNGCIDRGGMDGRNLPDCSQFQDVFYGDVQSMDLEFTSRRYSLLWSSRRHRMWSFKVQQTTSKQQQNGLISLFQVGACQCPHPCVAQGQSSGLSHRQRSSTTYSLAQRVPRWRFFWSVFSRFSGQKTFPQKVLLALWCKDYWTLPSKGRKPHAQQCVKACPGTKASWGDRSVSFS